MTREDAIKHLENMKWLLGVNNTTVDDIPLTKVIDDIAALLKAQEPIEPKVDVDEWRCGNCGHKLEHQELLGENVLFHEQYSYCPQCGRAVKRDG